MWGLSLFGIGSLMCGLSHAKWPLILGRVIQGCGGALTIPAVVALLISTFPEGERGKALGINTGISSIFLIIGPAIGGLLTQYISWRSIFFMNLPIVTFGLVMASILLKKGSRKKESFHFTGALALLAGIVLLVVGLMQANVWGWSSPWTLLLLGISPFFFALFVWISTHATHPIIDFNLFRNPLFTVASISQFITQTIVTVTVLWAIYFQEQLDYTPAKTGLLIFIAAFPVFLMAPLGGYIADRFGPRLPMLIGYALLIFALGWLLFMAQTKDIIRLLPGLLGFGCGLPMIMSPNVALALSQVDSEKLGAASGINTEISQLAATMGIGLMTAVYHGTVRATGSHAEGFSAIALVAGIFAIVGFLLIFFAIKKKAHARGLPPLSLH